MVVVEETEYVPGPTMRMVTNYAPTTHQNDFW
jgi:hypothetical protein